MFSYEEFTSRNLGFVSPEDQEKLLRARVFIPGVGGMGGVALSCLARAGVGTFIISDPDHFEVSNFNRQIFADLDSLGKSKAAVAAEKLLRFNPEIQIQIVGADWPQRLPELLSRVDVVINGCDDLAASIALYRAARTARKTVVDALPASLPNVYVVAAEAPRPEETFRFPSRGKGLDEISGILRECARCETLYVLTHSSSLRYVVKKFALEMILGKRPRISHAPMVWMTGLLMSYEALKFLLNKPQGCDHRGIFLDPWKMRWERPGRGPLAWIKRYLVQKTLKSWSQ